MKNRTGGGSLISLLRSRKLAYGLILLLTIATVMGVLTPRAVLMEDARYLRLQETFPAVFRFLDFVGLEHYYTSAWYRALVALLFINTLFCTMEQWKKAVREAGKPQPGRESGRALTIMGAGRAEILAALKKNRYKVDIITDKNKETVIIGRRGILGLFGSPLFHLFLLILILGVLLSGLTRFYGFLILAEGETLPVVESSFVTANYAPYARRGEGELRVTLESLEVRYDSRGFPFRFASNVTLQKGGAAPSVEQVEQAAPTPFAGHNLYQLERGYSPLVLLLDENGAEVWGAFLYLETIPGRDGELYRDELNFPYLGENVTVELLPDGKERRIGEGPWEHSPSAPVLKVRMPNREEVLVPLGESAALGDLLLLFPELRQWSGLNVVRDPGLPVVVAGFTGIVAGLCLLFFLSYHRLEIRINGDGARVSEVRRREKILPLSDVKQMFGLPAEKEGEEDAGL